MITANAFDTIKETLNISDVTIHYGVVIKRNNKALCPFHSEKTASFTIFPKTNSFKCFGCGVGGSIIDFVMQMYGIDALEAAKKLSMDYNLGLFDYKPSQEKLLRLKEQKEQREANKGLDKAFEGYINKAFDLLCEYLHLLQDWKTTHAPKSLDELNEASPLFIEACHQLDYIEYLTDGLLKADLDEQIGFYKTHREELRNIATRLCTVSRKTDESAKRGHSRA